MTTPRTLELAYEYLTDEMATLHALAMVLVKHLEDSGDSESDDGGVGLRLAQVLHDRLERSAFVESMRLMMFGCEVRTDAEPTKAGHASTNLQQPQPKARTKPAAHGAIQ